MRWRNTFYVERVPDSPNERASRGGSEGTRTIDIYPGSVAARAQAQLDFLGYATVVSTTSPLAAAASPTGDPTFRYLSRVVPHAYPTPATLAAAPGGPSPPATLFPKFASNFAHGRGLGIGRFNAALQGTDYAAYRQEVVYQQCPYLVRPDSGVATNYAEAPSAFPDEGIALASGWANSRYISRTWEQAGRFYTLREGQVFYEPNPATVLAFPAAIGLSYNQVPTGAPIIQPMLNVTYTWHRVPIAAYSSVAVQKGLGHVNFAQFDDFPAGTMLLNSVTPDFEPGPTGDLLLDVSFAFKVLYNPSFGLLDGGVDAGGVPDGSTVYYGWNGLIRVLGGTVLMSKMVLGGLHGPGPYGTYEMSKLFAPTNYLT